MNFPFQILPENIRTVLKGINPLDKNRNFSIKSTFNVWLVGIITCLLCLAIRTAIWGLPSCYTFFSGDYNEIVSSLISTLVTIVVSSFTLMIVAVQLASQQFSPRIVRAFFAGDTIVQGYLGLYIGAILYCYTIKTMGIAEQVLTIPVVVALFLSFICLIAFPLFIIYYVDNINAATITEKIKSRVVAETNRRYTALWSSQSHALTNARMPIPDADFPIEVRYPLTSGYLDEVDFEELAIKCADFSKNNPTVSIKNIYQKTMIGEFVSANTTELMAITFHQKPTSKEKTTIIAAFQDIITQTFLVTKYRSMTQDVNFGIRQLVDIGIKAISPAVNDPTTCINCIDYLGDIIRNLADKEFPSRAAQVLEKENIYVNEFNFYEVVDFAFDQIYQWGKGDPVIIKRLIKTLSNIVPVVENPYNLAVLMKEVESMELDFLLKDAKELTEKERAQFNLENRESIKRELERFHRKATKQIKNLQENGILQRFEQKTNENNPTAARKIEIQTIEYLKNK